MPASEAGLDQVRWPAVVRTRLLTGRLARTLPSRRPELLDGSDEVGAVRLPHPLKHPVGSVLSKLPGESPRKRLLRRFAALKGGIGHVFSGTGAAQVGFGRGCGALHPLIPELLNIGGECRWSGCLGLRRGPLGDLSRG